jgi:non-ribosomal peptide synthetase component E (peptide arylation enzyme)
VNTLQSGTGIVPYPAEFVARYRAAGLWGTRTIPQELRTVADAHPDATALVAPDGRLTYAELDGRTDRIAAGLADLGLQPGEPILFQVTNGIGAVLAWYAVLKAGLVPVCTLAQHRGHEIGAITDQTAAAAHIVDAGPAPGARGCPAKATFDLVAFARDNAAAHPTVRHVVTVGGHGGDPDAGVPALEHLGAGLDGEEARRRVDGIQAAIGPDDLAVFQLSGGTTGTPKVIPRLHAEYWYNAAAYARAWGWDGTCRVAHVMPVIHNAGIVCALHAGHSAGATVILSPADAASAVPLLTAVGVTDVILGPGFLSGPDLAAWEPILTTTRRLILSGAKVPSSLFDALEARGVWSGQLFGMGEGLFLITPPGSARSMRAETVGVPLSPFDEVKVVDPATGEEAADGTDGELLCRGPYTIRGYFDSPDHNARAFTPDGFYRTGDVVAARWIDGVRCFSVEGRIKDLINRGGEKINAPEVEALLLEHPAIAAAAVVAMPDPRLGERACAFLVADGPHQPALPEIQAHLDGLGVAKFKWPERIEWLDDLPRSHVGKVDKQQLRAIVSAAVAAQAQEETSR